MVKKNVPSKPIPPAPSQQAVKFFDRYVSEFLCHEREDWASFLSKLRTCTDLSWLCEPGLGEPRFQYGVVWALVELWNAAHQEKEEARFPEHMRASPSRKKPGRPDEFPQPRHLQAFLLIVQQVFARKGPPPTRYRSFAAKILGHFFPEIVWDVSSGDADENIRALRERQRGRAKIYQRKNPGDANTLARHIVNDAMGMLESYSDLSR